MQSLLYMGVKKSHFYFYNMINFSSHVVFVSGGILYQETLLNVFWCVVTAEPWATEGARRWDCMEKARWWKDY